MPIIPGGRRTAGNVPFGANYCETPTEVARRVEELVACFELNFVLHRLPFELRGQQQSAAIMRALTRGPEALFLDEALWALDF